ncbi:MAG: diguanylate cyclase [Ignavibacteriales bacterium]
MNAETAKILVVDDEPNNVELVERRLHSAGYKTMTAYNGHDALRLAYTEEPDLVILDVMMPAMSGYEVCKYLKEDNATKDIPILFLTARGEIDDRVSGLELGAVDYITKPFHPKELLLRVANTLQQSQALQKAKEENERLQAISVSDDLTGLNNRRHFITRFSEELQRAKRYHYPLSCLMFDVDYFKNINDRFGHMVGDEILIDLAQIFRISVRTVDFIARYGGEEFVILLPQTDPEGAMQVAEKIRTTLAGRIFVIEDVVIKVTVSVGIASWKLDAATTEGELLRQADQALYYAKRRGRNQSQVYTPALDRTTNY